MFTSLIYRGVSATVLVLGHVALKDLESATGNQFQRQMKSALQVRPSFPRLGVAQDQVLQRIDLALEHMFLGNDTFPPGTLLDSFLG